MKRLILVIMVVIMIMGFISISSIKPVPVSAAGLTSMNITATQYWLYNSGTNNWAYFVNEASCSSVTQTAYGAGWVCDSSSPNYQSMDTMLYRFDVSTLPPADEIIRMVVHVGNCYLTTAPSYWSTDRLIVEKVPIYTAVPVVTDWPWSMTGLCAAEPLIWSSIPVGSGAAATQHFEVYPSMIEFVRYPSYGNYSFLGLTTNSMLSKGDPGWHNGAQHLCINGATVNLEVFYATAAASRTMHERTNAAEYTGGLLGTEKVNNTLWETPRAAFSDERVGFRVSGDPGTSFNIKLISGSGVQIGSVGNKVKVDGLCTQFFDLPVTLNDWIRAEVTDNLTNRVYSDWGRVELSPSSTQRILTVSAESTNFPPYDNAFSKYLVYKDGLCFLYWKTNMVVGDYANYSIKLLDGGDLSKTMLSYDMTTLNTNYYKMQDADNLDMCHWRYLIYSPKIINAGFDTRDGMIIDAGKEYAVDNIGFWQGTIRLTSDNSSITQTESAYFYLNDIVQGVNIKLKKQLVHVGELIEATVTVGSHSKVAERLSNVKVYLIGVGLVMGSTHSAVAIGDNKVTINAPSGVGDFQVRFEFYNDTLVPDFRYIKDVDFKVVEAEGGTGVPGDGTGTNDINTVWGMFLTFLEDNGWLNDMGKVIIIIIAMITCYVVCRKDRILRIVLPGLICVASMIAGWIPIWMIVVLALGAGVTVYQIFRKKAQGGE